MTRLARSVLVVLAMAAALAAALELVVRLTGVEHVVSARVSARLYPGGEPPFVTRGYDPVLQWRLLAGAWLPNRIGRVNALGFVGREIETRKRPGAVRILALGDSVTYGVWQCGAQPCRNAPYPEALERLLHERTGDERYEVVDAGVYGYTSLQGYRYYATYLGGLDADIVTAMFGWNDHGAVNGIEGWEPRNAALADAVGAARRLATYRTALAMLALLRAPREPPKYVIPTVYRPRVTPPDFARHLTALATLARERGAHVLFVTEPAGPLTEPYRRGEVMNVWGLHAIPDYHTYVSLHAAYNDRMRAIARYLDVPLVDADAEFSARDRGALFDPEDLVHPNRAGHAVIAQLIYDRLAAEGWLAPAGAGTRQSAAIPTR